MCEKLVTLKELENITGIDFKTIKTYLQGYRFTKFERSEKIDNRRKVIYCFNKSFLDTFINFLWLKRKINAIKQLQKYYQKEVRCNYD